MKLERSLLLALFVLVGCKPAKVNDGYAIDLTLVAGSSIGSGDLKDVAWLDLEVTGAETYSDKKIAMAGKLDPTTRSAGLRYRPRKTSGTIDIGATLTDAGGNAIASGALHGVGLTPGTQLLTLSLMKPASPVSDLGVTPDLAVPQLDQGTPSTDMATECAPTAIRCKATDHSFQQVCDATGHWQDQSCMTKPAPPIYACTEAKHKCVDTGWAQWSYAAAKPSPRFTTIPGPASSGEDIAVDAWTGVSWQIETSATYTWTQAQTYCANLLYGGMDDWRLPSSVELQTLVDYTLPLSGGPTIVDPFAANTQASGYWASSASAATAANSWTVEFTAGAVVSKPATIVLPVRCAR